MWSCVTVQKSIISIKFYCFNKLVNEALLTHDGSSWQGSNHYTKKLIYTFLLDGFNPLVTGIIFISNYVHLHNTIMGHDYNYNIHNYLPHYVSVRLLL